MDGTRVHFGYPAPMDADALYRALAGGDPAPEPIAPSDRIGRELLDRALQASRHPSGAARLGALLVARAVGGDRGAQIALDLADDPDPEVRRQAGGIVVADRSIPLADPLPESDRALAKLLARVGPGDRRRVLDAIDPAAIRDLLARWRSGGDTDLCRGLLIAAADLQIAASVPRARQLASDPDPAVRAAATTALGALGGPSTLPALARGLQDPSPEVVAAAADALMTAALRANRSAFAVGELQRLPPDPPPEVQRAVIAALARVPEP